MTTSPTLSDYSEISVGEAEDGAPTVAYVQGRLTEFLVEESDKQLVGETWKKFSSMVDELQLIKEGAPQEKMEPHMRIKELEHRVQQLSGEGPTNPLNAVARKTFNFFISLIPAAEGEGDVEHLIGVSQYFLNASHSVTQNFTTLKNVCWWTRPSTDKKLLEPIYHPTSEIHSLLLEGENPIFPQLKEKLENQKALLEADVKKLEIVDPKISDEIRLKQLSSQKTRERLVSELLDQLGKAELVEQKAAKEIEEYFNPAPQQVDSSLLKPEHQQKLLSGVHEGLTMFKGLVTLVAESLQADEEDMQ